MLWYICVKGGEIMEIGDKIRLARKKRGLTQQQLGNLCGMADSAIRRYENNRANPKIETIQKIANALDVPLSEFYSYIFNGETYIELANTKNEDERQSQLEILKQDHRINFDKITQPVNNKNELILLSNYEKLNDTGKDEALKRVKELTEIPRYTELLSGASAAKTKLKTEKELTIIEPPEDNT